MKANEKIDLYKLHKQEYATPRKPVLIEIKPATYLAIVGQGEPGESVFSDKIGALYAVAFTIKMGRKFAGKGDYTVCKPEAQWWGKDGQADFSATSKNEWCWKLLIRTPDFITQGDVAKAVPDLLKKGKSPAVKEVQIESLTEGLCVQMLHIGPYDQEQKTVQLMCEHAQQHGLEFCGRHHEIYLSDPRRVAPDKLKTILRLPVQKRQITE